MTRPEDTVRGILWTSRARRFAANLAAFERRAPAEAARVAAAARAGLDAFQLGSTADGNYQVLTHAAHGDARWLGGLANHKAATAMWQFDRKATPVPHPIAFDGVGFGWLFLHVLETTANSYLNYSCAAYVLESDPLALAMLFHMHDLQAVIAQDRVRWIVEDGGDAVVGEFKRQMRAQAGWTIPERFVTCALRTRAALPLAEVIGELRGEREARRREWLTHNEAMFAGRDAAAWGRRFAEAREPGGEPLRVLGITSRYTTVLQHSMAELQRAARAAGARMEIAIEPDDQSLENPFVERVAEFQPDLIVQISRMRYENPSVPRNVPFLCWDQDNLPCMRTPAASESLDALTFVAGHGALHGFVYLGWPGRNVIPCHLAAATHRYTPRVLSDAERARYACDFSYVSNAADSPAALAAAHAARFAGGDGHAAALFAALREQVAVTIGPDELPWHEGSVRAAVMAMARGRGLVLADVLVQELVLSALLIADRAFRHETLEWVSAFCRETGRTLRIYGAGWEKHPTLAAHAAGPAQAGDELQTITQATRINLQIIGTGVLHPRLLDGLACGGFFLYRETLNDRADRGFLAARDIVSRHAAAQAAATVAELDAATDAHVTAAWGVIRGKYVLEQQRQGFSEMVMLRGLASSHRLPHPVEVVPELQQIAFDSRETFAAKAAAFLSDDAARTQTAAVLRARVQEHFSYDARWRSFVAHMRDMLAAATSSAR